MPTAQAPSDTASSASCARVIPQNLIVGAVVIQSIVDVSVRVARLDVGGAHQRLTDQHGVDPGGGEFVEFMAARGSPTRRP